MPPFAVASCDSTTDSSHPLHSLCRLIDEHAGGAAAWVVALIDRVIWPLVVLAVAIVAMRVVRGIADRAVRRAGADPQIEALIHNVLVAVGVVVALGAALNAEGLDLTIFLTIGGLSTLAIGLAFQDLLRNILAGIFLLVERPFRIGDIVTIDDLTGSVATIELRTTCLRLADGKLAVIPNLDAFNTTVVNLSAFEMRQFSVSLWVPSGADLEGAIRAAREVLEATPEAAREPVARVQPAVDIDGGVTLQLQYWLEYRGHDPDAVAASVVRRVQAALAGDPPPPDLTPVAPVAAELETAPTAGDPEAEPAAPRRRRRLRPHSD